MRPHRGLDEVRLVALPRRGPPVCSAPRGCSTCSSRAAPTSSSRPSEPPQQRERRAGPAYAGPVRILLVSQMYPGPDAPDLGTFVAQVERELSARGHEIELAVLDTRAGGRLRYLTLARRAHAASRPDVVYAHFLVPSGFIAALAGGAPLVVTAHGRDVRNIGAIPGVAAATRLVVRRAAAVICVSDYLRRELETKLPEARGKVEVVSSGVDRDRFAVTEPPPGPHGFVCVGALDERKNVVRLADAFTRLEEGTLTFAGDGPLRSRLEGRDRVRVLGRVPHDEIPRLLSENRVLAQPSLVEPLGQALLEAMACGRSVVATRIGGPPEFVPPDAGVLVDPLDVDALARGLEQAAALPCPNIAAREATAEHDVRRQAERIEAILSRAAGRDRPA
jgi:glycosyltransferase involved in cell wall biosynthesis